MKTVTVKSEGKLIEFKADSFHEIEGKLYIYKLDPQEGKEDVSFFTNIAIFSNFSYVFSSENQ